MLSLPLLLLPTLIAAESTVPANNLVGVWEATRHFGPALRGPLTLTRKDGRWIAEVAGQRADANSQGDSVSVRFPSDQGDFRGTLAAGGKEIRGHWIQPPTVTGGQRYASPVILKAHGENVWRGEVVPREDEFTLYLVASAGENGVVKAFLENPDRNLGFFLNADRLEREGDAIKLIGHRRNNNTEQALAQGVYHPDDDPRQDQFSLYFSSPRATFDFSRAGDASFFYARGKNPAPYRYEPPPAEDDGWPTGSLSEAGISEAPLASLIATVIDPPAASVHDPSIHAILIARHGKLVFEEYFHGFHREKPHDTRSASKSLTATLVGSLIEHGAPLSTSTPVYRTIYGNQLPADLDPRKNRMTVEHLLTMTSGYFCDDRNPAAPGNEDVMQDQTSDPDWYHYTLNVPMIADPGSQPVYCSANPNLIGDVLTHITGKSLMDLFQERIAGPLQLRRYYLNLSPTGDPYMGGGINWLPRDFMKLGQVMLNGGTWNGRRIVSPEWARRSTSALENLRQLQYGYLWWSINYPYKGKTVRAFFAGGNGGQVVMGIPDLDLLIAFYAGNYSDPVAYKIQEDLVPQYILPAVDRNH
ncbi:MAG TPA: serine hydrolase [Terriglobales bacterium]|nr:serine hydrolase [Terriglobales bacterium]